MTRSLFAIGALAAVLSPQAVGAQVVSSSAVPDLSKMLKPGEVLIVTNDKGERTTGRLSDLSSSSLRLQVPGKAPRGLLVSDAPVLPEQRQFDIGVITRIDRRDSLREGTLIGLAAGIGFAYVMFQSCQEYEGDSCFNGLIGIAALGAGPAIGAAIDRGMRATIYRAPTDRVTASLGLSTGLQRKSANLSVKLAF